MKIYITHCSAKKDDSLRDTQKKVTPDKLYLATPLQRFINKCKNVAVNWAIFSDLYGVWFPENKHAWYEKSPNKVSDREFNDLLQNFDRSLQKYEEIIFYYNPGRFHNLYKRLLNQTKLRSRVKLITHLEEIK